VAGFFSAIQGYFSGSFSGRYLGIVLAEVCRADPALFNRYFKDRFGRRRYTNSQLSLTTEVTFRTRTGYRRADLALMRDGKPAALIELKHDDELMPRRDGKTAQLHDYLWKCRSEGLDFLLLCKDPPSELDAKAIRENGQQWDYISGFAEHFRMSSHPAGGMLFDYFRERGLIVEPLNEDYLYRFFHRLLKPWGHSGRIVSKDSLSEGPAQFQALLSNMRIIAADLATKVRPIGSNARNRTPTIDFAIYPEYAVNVIRRELSKKEHRKGGVIEATDKARRGGRVYVYAMQTLGGKGKKWLDLEYGMGFEIAPGKSRSLSPFLYSVIYGQGFVKARVTDRHRAVYQEQGLYFSAIGKPEHKAGVEHELLKLIRKSAKATSRVPLVTRQGRAALLRI
jgi:hypothetical protein